MTTTKQYDYLNRLLSVSSAPSAASALNFNYSYNSANQRTAVTNADDARWVYQYDSLGQVISGKKYWSDGTLVAGQQFEYTFDDIGNRKTTRAGGSEDGTGLRSATYDANSLNQYTSRTAPGAVDIIGSANSNATVTVNNQSTYRKGEYFWRELGLDNSQSAVYASVTNLAVLNNGTNADIIATNIGTVFLPQTPESFGYDADGNLTNDGRWTYTWDAENRLIAMESLSTLPAAARQKLELAYDSHWRRTQKIVSSWSGSAYVPQSTNRFVYDGWNLIAVFDSQSSILQSFTWGLDLSGSMQGAGGVGGLLFVSEISNGEISDSHCPAFDGNGNVMALVSLADGTVQAQYEYGPFGELLRATGAMANANPFRFSTKYQEDETELLYYGYRYYSASTGRWLSRDTIQEHGGLGLYGFLDDNPVGTVDRLGLYKAADHAFLTTEAFDAAHLGVTSNCRNKMLKAILKANDAQDSWGIGGNLWNNVLHYNRDITPEGNVGQRHYDDAGLGWDAKYGTYLDDELGEFRKALGRGGKKGCKEALKALGHLSHSWQDFFIHAIRADGEGDREQSEYPGFRAFSEGKTGDPDNRGNFYPSSFGATGGGEHPGWGKEPIGLGQEWAARYSAAYSYSIKRFGSLLPEWLRSCRCYCDK